MESTLTRFVIVWFIERCIANIIYLSKAKDKYHVMYVSA